MSNYRYQYYLNDTLVENPVNWETAEKVIKRSDKYNGLFVEFVTPLTFYNDGYEIIKDAGGICSTVNLDIKISPCEGEEYETFFTGYIQVNEVEWDVHRKSATVKPADSSLAKVFLDLSDIEVSHRAKESINGEAISLTERTIDVKGYLAAQAAVSRKAVYVKDYFQHILNFISDNRITFVSDLFETVPVRHTQKVVFNNGATDLAGTAVTIRIAWEADRESGTISGIGVNLTRQATVAATLEQMCFALNEAPDPALNALGNYYAERLHRSFLAHVTYNAGAYELTIENDFAFRITGVYFLNPTVQLSTTVTTTTSFVFGLKNLSLNTGNMMRAATNPDSIIMSFDKLYEDMNKWGCLGMSLKTINGTPTLRIEQADYFNENTETLELENVPGIKYKASETVYSIANVSNGTFAVSDVLGGVVPLYPIPIGMKYPYVSRANCGSKIKNLLNGFNGDFGDIYTQRSTTSDNKDDTIFVFETDGTATRAREYRMHTGTGPLTYEEATAMNVLLSNQRKLINWQSKLIGTADNIYDNEFEYPLTHDQIADIIENQYQFIKFSPNDETIENNGLVKDIKRGWVQEVAFNFKTGLTKFKLLTP